MTNFRNALNAKIPTHICNPNLVGGTSPLPLLSAILFPVTNFPRWKILLFWSLLEKEKIIDIACHSKQEWNTWSELINSIV